MLIFILWLLISLWTITKKCWVTDHSRTQCHMTISMYLSLIHLWFFWGGWFQLGLSQLGPRASFLFKYALWVFYFYENDKPSGAHSSHCEERSSREWCLLVLALEMAHLDLCSWKLVWLVIRPCSTTMWQGDIGKPFLCVAEWAVTVHGQGKGYSKE